jgi:hypothetical protein
MGSMDTIFCVFISTALWFRDVVFRGNPMHISSGCGTIVYKKWGGNEFKRI